MILSCCQCREISNYFFSKFRNLKSVCLELKKEQLELSCRKGAVYLEGIIPSEIEHQILLRTLTDVMGISSLIDRIQINELDWEREDVAPGTTEPEPTPYEQMLYDEEPYTENIFGSEEDEIPYDLPDKVPPEKIDKQAE